jgi:chromosome segregation ATPase
VLKNENNELQKEIKVLNLTLDNCRFQSIIKEEFCTNLKGLIQSLDRKLFESENDLSQSRILAERLQQEIGKLTTDNMQLQSQFEENRSNQALVLENHVQRICKLEIENAQNLTFKRNFKFFLNENYPDLAANPNHASSGDGGGQPKRQKHDGSSTSKIDPKFPSLMSVKIVKKENN